MGSLRESPYLWARGFMIAPEGRYQPPAGFCSVAVQGWTLSTESRTQVSSMAAADGRFVVVIGYVLDVRAVHDDVDLIVRTLLDALGISEAAFFAYLDQLGGRYAVFYGDRNRASILGDACATRTIFYARTEPLIASHHALVAEACGAGRSDHWQARQADRRRHTTYGYPAGTTPDRNVGLLLGNMVLRLDSMTYERYYPRRDLPSLSIEDAAATLAVYFHNQLDVLVRRYRIVCSLTAGLDSRATLAALRPYLDGCRFFTYRTSDDHEIDAVLAALIARRHRLAHGLMPTPDTASDGFARFKKILRRNNYHPHGTAAAYGYLSLFQPGDIHLRSNLYEIARAFHRSRREWTEELDARGMAALYFREFSDQDHDLVDAFSDYVETSEFATGLWNYDPYDVFYLEQRMSCWHALVLLEADPSVDTYLLMNARCCLEVGLAVPRTERIAASVFTTMMADLWPELLELPINPKRLSAIPAE